MTAPADGTGTPAHRAGATARAGAVRGRWRAGLAIGLGSAVGLVAFTWPLFADAHSGANMAHAGDAPWIMALMLPVLLIAVLAEVATGNIDAKGVALLGVLAACGAALRIPGAGTAGFEPVFFLLFPAGYVLGRQFGFLLGALTLFASALITGGVGPWLPFQMIAAAWMGYGAGCLPRLSGRPERVQLAAYAAVASMAFGLLMDLWFWPFGAGTTTTLSFEPGAPLAQNLVRFLAFHFTTALGFDLPRAALNAVLILTLGRPVIAALRRAHRRAAFGAPVEVGAPSASYALEDGPRQPRSGLSR
jgi:energy-coupling factor transport system substrate-specific component